MRGPEFPDALAYLWAFFERLDALRTVSEHGPNRLTVTDLLGGMRLFGCPLAPHEVEALITIDLVTLYPNAGQSVEAEDRPAEPAWPERKG